MLAKDLFRLSESLKSTRGSRWCSLRYVPSQISIGPRNESMLEKLFTPNYSSWTEFGVLRHR
jgi:hypothetical protein